MLSVNKNKELIKAIKVYNKTEEKISMTKVMYKAYLSRAAEDYLSTQIKEYNVEWKETEYEIPDDEQNRMINIDSQFSGIINLKRHSRPFVNAICDIAADILIEINSKEIKNQIKRRKE